MYTHMLFVILSYVSYVSNVLYVRWLMSYYVHSVFQSFSFV